MKKFICFAMLGTTVILLTAAVLPPPAPVAPYEREQVRGNVRVVLLKVERATIFTSQAVRDAKPGKFYPVPIIGVTYMVEALGGEQITAWTDNFSDKTITVGNHPVGRDDFLPNNIVPGSSAALKTDKGEGEEMPIHFDKKRFMIEELQVRVDPRCSGSLTLKLEAGFNGHTENFVFDNLPVN